MTPQSFTYSEAVKLFSRKAAGEISRRYRRYGVEFDDVLSEINLWILAKGSNKIRRWLESEPQQTTRIHMEMRDAGRRYAEKEKAAFCGYEPDDVHFYSVNMIEAALPLALDPTWDGLKGQTGERSEGGTRKPPHEGGDVVAVVADVRKAIQATPDWVRETLLTQSRGDDRWESAVAAVIDYLGGSSPYVGQRKVLANSQAQAITAAHWNEVN